MHTDYQTFVMQTMQSSDYQRTADMLLLTARNANSVEMIGYVLWHAHALLALLRLDADWILGSVENEAGSGEIATLRRVCARLADTGNRNPAGDLREVVRICVSILRREHNIPLVECYRQSIAYLSQSGRLSP